MTNENEIHNLYCLLNQLMYVCQQKKMKNVKEIDMLLKYLQDAVPIIITNSGIFFEIIDGFFGKNFFLNFIACNHGTSALTAFICELFAKDVVIDSATQVKIKESAFTYLERITKFSSTYPSLKVDVLITKWLNSFLKLDLLLVYLQCLHANRTAYDPQSLQELHAKVCEIKDTHCNTSIETAVIIANTIRQMRDTLKSNVDEKAFLDVFKTLQVLVNIVKNHKSDGNNVFCKSCTSTKRHGSVAIIKVCIDIFTGLAARKPITEVVASKMCIMTQYALKTLDGLVCDDAALSTKGILIHIYNLVAYLKVFGRWFGF